jgi:glycosyltransferase involved in cell wall biosynthesis
VDLGLPGAGEARPLTHIGLNLVYLVPGETGGMEVYARELLPELLAAASPGTRFTAFTNREAEGDPIGDLVETVTVPVHATSRVQRVRAEQQHLPRLGRRAGVDLMHSLASTAPLHGRFARVVTIHDLIYKVHPEAHRGVLSLGMGVLVPAAARRSRRIIAVSQNTADDIVRLFRVPRERIDVVPQGLGAPARAEPAPETEVRARFELGERPIALSVSAKRPHKNLVRLLEALALIPGERRPMLVVPGYPTWHETELRERAAQLGVADDVRFLAWVEAGELEALYAMAGCFVFPSLYEGFGFPVLEAMDRGVPVACSDRSSLPEVAGEAALLFDPESPRAIADAVERLLADPVLTARLRDAGRAQAARFTWAATAQGTLRSYERALEATG